MREFHLLKQLDHPNVMKVYEAYEDVQNIFIVTELLKGGELFDKLIEEGQFIESTCAKLIKQILYALAYCHDRKLVHRYPFDVET
jgi:calcium-dependent protein kinase